jgi:hypothetical protein
MKKISILYMVSAFAFTLISSCSESVLDTKPQTEFAEQAVWTDPALAAAYVNNVYNNIPWGWDMTCLRVDEVRERADQDDFNVNNMIITPDNAGWGDWGGRYRDIRACNIFLENIDKLPAGTTLIDGKTIKDRLKGEATFLRAWNYHMLLSYYGGVPLIKKAYVLTDEFSAPRDSYADCVKFISDECDIAAGLLPVVNSGAATGRATKGAALALKSRLLLYAASDLHNTTKFSSFSKPELLGYVGGDRAARWKAAKDAAKAVIDLGVYSLYKPEPTSGEQATKNYQDLFVSSQSSEDIFVRFFSLSASKGVGMFELYPNGWYGNGRCGLTSEMVDSYEMADGTAFSRTNPAQNLEPYKNRDPRFYGTVIYEGAKLRPRTADLSVYDPVGVMQAGTWEKWDNAANKMVKVYGLDTRNGVANSWNSSLTGTGCRKFLNTAIDVSAVWQNNADLTWRYFRYAEILLNYAEACIELGEDPEARTYMNMVRKRASMPDVTESGAALKARYRNERKVELVLEDHRFFDVRRWLVGPEAYHNMHGVTITYKLNADHTTATIPTIEPVQIMTGSWNDKAYFFPIGRDEVNKNAKLVQNPGY